MAAQSTENPLPTFTGLDGQPLSDGYVYFGEPEQNSIEYPISVYYDEALTIPATQPIRTNAGYLWRNGTPTRVWVNGNYSTLVQDSSRRQVYYAPNWSAASAANITYEALGTGAQVRDVQSKLQEIPSVRDFGAVGDDSTDDTAAIQAAIDAVSAAGVRKLIITDGVYKVTSQLNIASNFVTIEWDSPQAVIKKYFNGEVFRVAGGEVELLRCSIDGQGATYTGGAIRLVTTGANSFKLPYSRIRETASAPVLIEANAGSLMKIIGGLLQPYNANPAGPAHAVAMTAADTGPNNRKIIGISTGGAPIMDATGAETVEIIGCDGAKVTTSATSKKIHMVGNRMQTGGGNIGVFGLDHNIVGNTVASSFELGAGATNCTIRANSTDGPEVLSDASGNNTNFYRQDNTFNIAWTAASVNPAIGDGTLSAVYSRFDKLCSLRVDILMGASTTYGTGEYSFSLPFTSAASQISVGSAWAFDSGTAFRIGVVVIVPGATTCQVYFDNSPSSASSLQPFTWAVGDRLRFEITYQIG